MAEVSAEDRKKIKHRDGGRCASCGAETGLTMQHRAAIGMGGTSYTVGFAGLLTACGVCNGEYEHVKQKEALVYGWKIRSWVTAHVVPVFYARRRLWAVLSIEGGVRRIPEAEAVRMMRAAYGPQWDEWVAELPTRFGLEMTK
ncbi:MAG: hypothetical protein JSS74_09060 [Actinobacteria bacterium]|nr:hypothetical protein [Actinomycetota bacterium]